MTANNGNTVVAGTLDVTGPATVTGATVMSSQPVAMIGNVSVNTDKFMVTANNGNTEVAGTLYVTGAST